MSHCAACLDCVMQDTVYFSYRGLNTSYLFLFFFLCFVCVLRRVVGGGESIHIRLINFSLYFS